MEGLNLLCFALSCLFIVHIPVSETSGIASCPRDKSRIVANIVQEKILPAFDQMNVEPSNKCPFSLTRNMFGFQEMHKVMDSGSRWTCEFCGKAFVSENFLDMHFDNRHVDQIQTDNVICLSDECDVFRCDIVSGASIPDYWDVALCLEDDMQELMSQCKVLIEKCVPKGLTVNETKTLKGAIMDNVCSFLTCSKFWNNDLETTDSQYMALYIVLTIMTCFGILIYYFVFYNYFYSGLVDIYDSPQNKSKHKFRSYDEVNTGPPRYHHSRHRRGVT